MKTSEEIVKAKSILVHKVIKPTTTAEQQILLQGMIVALNWVLETGNGTTLERIVTGGPLSNEQHETN